METLNHHYLTASAAGGADGPYQVFLRAHLRQGCFGGAEALRWEISSRVPALASLCYREHIVPLISEYQHYLETVLKLSVRAVDVEVQYHPKTVGPSLPGNGK